MPTRRGWFVDHWDPTVLREFDGERWTGRKMSTLGADEAPAPLDAIPTGEGGSGGPAARRSSVASVLDRIMERARDRAGAKASSMGDAA